MSSTYVIGEIGQNHNGSLDLAKKMIDLAALPVIDAAGHILKGVDAVKFQKRDLAAELTASAMAKPYDSPHSFGRTYGEHRAALELTDEQHFELYTYAKSQGLQFVETLCAIGCLSLLDLFKPDYLKVASRDLTNEPLLAAMAETKIPIIVSTGMSGEPELEAALSIITRYHSNITILHCLSEYPAQFKNLNLNTIPYLTDRYPQYTIGYSDHSVGIMIPAVAVALGAKVIEKHITISRALKGSDQAGSLGPDGLYRMMRDIRHVEESMGEKTMFAHPAVAASQTKLERSLAAKRDIQAGEIIGESDLHLLSPGTGFRWQQRGEIIGKTVIAPITKDELIEAKHIASSGTVVDVGVLKKATEDYSV